MAYVTPNNRILLLHNVPLDMEYENTMWWIDQATQTSTMQSFTKYTCAPTTYQRVNKNTCRVEHNADALYDVNYMMFQNTNFGNKWFYAFVEKIDYINDAVSEITYRIDEIQTWYFDFTPMYSFVERCHSATDSIGDNIVDEPMGVGEYVANQMGKASEFEKLCVVILTIVEPEGVLNSANVQFVNNILSGCTGLAFNYYNVSNHTPDSQGITQINTYLTHYVGNPDQVVAMYIVPTAFIMGVNPSTGEAYDLPYTHTVEGEEKGGYPMNLWVNSPRFVMGGVSGLYPITAGTTKLDGYTPKNNKMYTYPYNFITVTNNMGEAENFRYEFFDSLRPRFNVDASATLPVTAKMQPLLYKGATGANPYVFESMTLENFPMCSWNSDYFKGWLVQNSVGGVGFAYNSYNRVNTMQEMGFKDKSIEMSKVAIVDRVWGIMSSAWQAYKHADILKGGYSNGNINIAHDRQNFHYARMSVCSEYAELIDDYFTRFGYAQHKVMLPPRHNRTQFTYVKTVGCKISGSIPCDSEAIICNAFDKGITFWTNTANVGNYLVNNGLLT